MLRGHLVRRRVVRIGIERCDGAVESVVGDAIRQRLAPARYTSDHAGSRLRRARVFADEIGDALAWQRRAVDVENPTLHLDPIARQADGSFDQIVRFFDRGTEHDDVAALRQRWECAAGKQRRSERQRIAAVAVGEFRHHEVIANQQGRLHRARRNADQLEQHRADHERDDERRDQRAQYSGDEPFILLRLFRHALVARCEERRIGGFRGRSYASIVGTPQRARAASAHRCMAAVLRLSRGMREDDILFERRGAAGLVTLNRPQALNAVNHGMVNALAARLAAWASDPAVTRVIIHAAGERAFSAGGDIRALYELGRAGRQAEMLPFWRDEYQLNHLIKHYPKPYVAVIDGIVMGGGVGISVHGSHRVAGEKFQFAMPEVGIGFFPDVGATWFLPRLPGQIGAYCALTGERLRVADGLASGVATHHVAGARFPDLIDALAGTVPVDAVLAAFADKPGEGALAPLRPAIDRLFAADKLEEILAALDAEGPDAEWAGKTAAVIRTKSPTSLKVALAQVRRGADWSFSECMRAEFRIVSRIVYGHDFYEGVRATIIDKDNAPRWRPGDLAGVGERAVEEHFAALEEELALP
jgi:enoyl-CoA hydratase